MKWETSNAQEEDEEAATEAVTSQAPRLLMTELLIFAAAALSAMWAKGRLDQAATTLAVLLAWAGVNGYDWIGWSWDWKQAGVYGLLAVVLFLAIGWFYRDDLRYRGGKPAADYIALGVWGIIQQAVLLGWMAQVNPVLAVAVFALVHMPNPTLFVVTAIGGAASAAIAVQFGVPAILPAGLLHAGLSWFLRDFAGIDMSVGRSYRNLNSKEA